jgi:uncharacterized protein (DUF1501 family)
MLSRRRFLKEASFVSLVPCVPGLLARAANAAGAQSDKRVLVVIQLDGGNDGLNTVVPYCDDEYGRNRQRLRLNLKDVHKLNDEISLHPRMQGAKKLFDRGELAIVQGVGYPNPNRSHFSSMRIWQTGRFDEQAHDEYGWLGRALDSVSTRSTSSGTSGIYIGEQETPVALWGRRSIALGLSRADDLKLDLELGREQPVNSPEAKETLDQFVTRHVLSAYCAADRFMESQAKSSSDAGYPNTELASHLRLISQLLKSGSQARVFYTAQPGYDTHSVQLSTHAELLQEFSDSLAAFLDDLRAAKLDDRVLILAFSEFGRRVKENDSQGTDHGAAGPVFLAGGRLQGGLLGTPPDLSDLDEGDLKAQFDFRQVYATILDQWLGTPSRPILGSQFEPLPLLKS